MTSLNAILLLVSITVGLAAFLVFDLLAGDLLTAKPQLSLEEKPYVAMDLGWYQLKKNFSGEDEYGPLRFSVATDAHGFRKATDSEAYENYEVVFLGDSFVYGVNGPWEESFVGMFGKRTGKRVLNTGVTSYSPTAYLYQYNKALNAGLLAPGHIVIVGLDISDVQDEAGIWLDGEEHPIKRDVELAVADARGLRDAIKGYLPLTHSTYMYFKEVFAPQDALPTFRRAAFTYEEWGILDQEYALPNMKGYAPLGVAGGLAKLTEKLSEIVEIGNAHQASVYFLIWPWPDQILYADKFSWSEYVEDVCEQLSCSGVIDTFPVFRALADDNDDWYELYYLSSDVHFNEAGNAIIADALIEHLRAK